MPNRILFERICTSETLAALSPEEERLFIRVLVQADDYGRFYAHPSILRARCFPLQLDGISDADIERWRDGVMAAGLITVYTDDGREYLQIPTWSKYQRMRAKDSKFPSPPASASNGAHPHADVSNSRTSADIRGSRARPPDSYSYPDANSNADANTPARPRAKDAAHAAARTQRGPRAYTLSDDAFLALAGLPTDLMASEFHTAAEDALVAIGFVCEREVPVDDRGDGRAGRIDLVATRGDEHVAIELDDRSPREKSATKLAALDDHVRVIVLRCPLDGPLPSRPGVDLVIGAGRDRANTGPPPPPRRAGDSAAARRTHTSKTSSEVTNGTPDWLTDEYIQAIKEHRNVR